MPTLLLSEFGQKYETLSFAVRSSCVAEDSADASAAGQMETVLSVKGNEEVRFCKESIELNNVNLKLIAAVHKCIESAHSARALQYQNEHDSSENGVAVIIQRMVENVAAAGVVFTCDPLTGNPAQVTINVAAGLGEVFIVL